jgi:2-oxoglutarate dehydrogenase E1 component
MKDFSYVTSAHPAYIENLYTEFVKDPESVDADMRRFFEGFDFAVSQGNGSTNGTAV